MAKVKIAVIVGTTAPPVSDINPRSGLRTSPRNAMT